MSENINATEQQEKLSRNNHITAYDILRLILSNWYWFVLSVVLCLLVAILYLQSTPPIYQRTATVMVKDSRKGSGAEMALFSDISGMMRSSADNEIYIFKSRHITEEVVRQNDLTTRYSFDSRMRTSDLYGRTPILVRFLTADEADRGVFDIEIREDGKLRAFNFLPNNEEFSVTAAPGDTVTTPLGDIVMVATPYMEQYLGEKISVSKMPLLRHTDAWYLSTSRASWPRSSPLR